MTEPAPPTGRVWHALASGLSRFVIVLFALLVLDVLWGVVSRYTPGIRPADWTEELAVYLLVWVSLLGSALTYREYGHLGVDYLITKLDPAAQRLAGVLVELCVLLFSVVGLCWGGGLLVGDALSSSQLTPVLQWKMGYVYIVVPLSGLFFVAFSLEHLFGPPAVHVPASDV